MITPFRVTGIDLTRYQRGWTCYVFFRTTTLAQFTDVPASSFASGRFALTALYRAYRRAKAKHKDESATVADRQKLGWN